MIHTSHASSARQQLSGLLQSARPKQWIKNLLVFAAPVSAGQVFDKSVLLNSVISWLIFTLASVAIYLQNDIRDIDLDRNHPTKKARPLASGQLAIRSAYWFSFITGFLAILLSFVLFDLKFFYSIAGYIFIQLLYVRRLKHKAILELYCVASGFLLRAIGGGIASGIQISRYFLVVVGFSALFVVAGKRFSEKGKSEFGLETRPSLSMYTESYLRFFWTSSFAISITFYALWAIELNRPNQSSLSSISLIPYSVAMFKYAQMVEQKNAEAPEDLLFSDTVFIFCIAAWLIIFGIDFIQ